jgi:hypothetical protein
MLKVENRAKSYIGAKPSKMAKSFIYFGLLA